VKETQFDPKGNKINEKEFDKNGKLVK